MASPFRTLSRLHGRIANASVSHNGIPGSVARLRTLSGLQSLGNTSPFAGGCASISVVSSPVLGIQGARFASKKGKNAKEEKQSSKKGRRDEEDDDAHDAGRGSKGKKGPRETAPVEEFDYEAFVEEAAKKHIERFQKDLAGLRTGSATPALLEHIVIKHKTQSLPLSQLAQITVKDQQTLIVLANDDSLIPTIEKAIRDDTTLSLNPMLVPDPSGTKLIRVPIPRPTDETKQQMAKAAAQMGEKVKGMIRSTRQAARDALKKKYKDVYSDDQVKKIEKEIQVLTDKFSKEVDDLLKRKTKELTG